MSSSGSIRGIVLGHGTMAEGLVDAVARISGVTGDVLLAVTNEGKSPDALKEELDGILDQGPTIVFVDLPSGSCALTARLCCREHPDEAVIFGVNLPLLLDFVFHRDMPVGELVPRLLEKGRDSLSSYPEFDQPPS